MRLLMRLVPAAALLAALGCGKEETPGVYPVSGEVVYDGKPAAGVQVYFMPSSGGNPRGVPQNPHGVTGPDGRFTLTTFESGDGAPEGSYQVILLWPKEGGPAEEESPPDRLFGWYEARRTKLTAKVRAGANTLPTFKLPAVNGPPPASEGIPGRN